MKTKALLALVPMILFACAAPGQTGPNASPSTVVEGSQDPLVGIERKTIRDIELRVAHVEKGMGSESLAQAIAEIDEWLFAPEDETKAIQMRETLVGTLRDQIESEVTSLARVAVSAKEGKSADDSLSKISSLLTLYPVPRTDGQRDRLDKIVRTIRSTSMRVEDIRRLRYNTWAISQIEKGLSEYNKIVKLNKLKKLISTDEDALIKVCVNSMKNIDPKYLEPVALDLYNYVIGLTTAKLSDKSRVTLAKGFAEPSTHRMSLIDF